MSEEKNNAPHRRRNHRHHNRGKKPADRANKKPNQGNEAVAPENLPPISDFETSSFGLGRSEESHRFRLADAIDTESLDDVEIPEDYPFADDALLFPNRKREEVLRDDSIEKTEIVGVRFKSTGKTYYFDPAGITAARGSFVIVETARGP